MTSLEGGYPKKVIPPEYQRLPGRVQVEALTGKMIDTRKILKLANKVMGGRISLDRWEERGIRTSIMRLSVASCSIGVHLLDVSEGTYATAHRHAYRFSHG